jgi:type I restriction enzyme S subunit
MTSIIGAPTNEARVEAWRLLEGRWEALMRDQGAITDLRQLVSNLALRGKLVPQDESEGDAMSVLEADVARLERPALVDARGDLLPEPHPLPSSWRWVPLGAVLTRIQAGWSPPALNRPKRAGEWGVLKVSACSWGKFKPEENKALEAGTEPRLDCEVADGDLLISRANTAELVARSVVVAEPPERLMLSDKTLRLTPAPGCLASYLNLANLGAAARDHYEGEASGTSESMKNVSQKAIRRAPIPLPPTGEQRRIIDAVVRFNALCDEAESRARRASKLAERAAVSLLAC